MSVIQALLLGVVQGITEFLPVSSSGHLAILEKLFQVSTKTGLMFEVLLHIGTLSAIIIAFRQDLFRLFFEGCKSVYDIWENVRIYFHNKNHHDAKRYRKLISNNYRKLMLLLFITTIPTAVEGLLLESLAVHAKNSFLAIAIGFFLTAVFLLVIDFFPAGNKIPKDVGYGSACLIGVIQGFSVFPGISRLGITIAACLLLGFNRKFAVKYSFLTAIPVTLGAMLLELSKATGKSVSMDTGFAYAVATVLAALAGFLCLKAMIHVMRKKRFCLFAVYCVLLGILSAACNFVL